MHNDLVTDTVTEFVNSSYLFPFMSCFIFFLYMFIKTQQHKSYGIFYRPKLNIFSEMRGWIQTFRISEKWEGLHFMGRAWVWSLNFTISFNIYCASCLHLDTEMMYPKANMSSFY